MSDGRIFGRGASSLLIVMVAGLIERHLARKGRNEKS